MSTALSESEKPVVLVVDDKKTNLRRQRELFELFGFHTIGASNEEEAYREVMSTPAIDMLFTDANLHPGKDGIDEDTSGVDLAREIRRRREKIPIVVFSAIFDEDKLPQDGDDPNFRCLPRKDYKVDQWEERMAEYLKFAGEYRESRRDDGPAALARIRKKYNIRDIDVEVLRKFVPDEGSEPESADAILKKLGYELHLVHAGSKRPTEAGDEAIIANPILFWIRKESEHYVAELYEHPAIYMHAPTKKEAVQQALLLMDGYLNDLREDEDTNSDELQSLLDYLTRVFD